MELCQHHAEYVRCDIYIDVALWKTQADIPSIYSPTHLSSCSPIHPSLHRPIHPPTSSFHPSMSVLPEDYLLIHPSHSVTKQISSNLIWARDSSVQFSHSVMSDSLRPHGLQHTRPPCPIPTPGAYSNSCPLSWWCHPTISSSCPLLLPPSIFPSIRAFSNESVLQTRWSKDWSFNFSISPSNEYLGLISFGINWLDLLAVQGTLKSLLQHHSSKASVLWCSAFFIV